MKKALMVLALIMLLASPAAAETVNGDLNGDGEVNVKDLSILLDYTVTNGLTEAEIEAADLNNDGKIDVFDALLMCQYILGMITEFPEVETQEVEVNLQDPVFSDDVVELRTSTTQAASNQNGVMELQAHFAEGNTGGQVELVYDSEKFNLVSIERGLDFLPENGENMFDHNPNFTSNSAMIMWVIPSGAEVNIGTIATLEFELK